MDVKDLIEDSILGELALHLIEKDASFREAYKAYAPLIASEIESAAVNPDCSCRATVLTYTKDTSNNVNSFIYNFAIQNNKIDYIVQVTKEVKEAIKLSQNSASGKVAKTTIKEWADFARSVHESKLAFRQFSASVVGDDVYVFFL